MALRFSHPSEPQTLLNPVITGLLTSICPRRDKVVPIHAGYDFQFDVFGAHGFALADIRATAEHFLLGLRDHIESSLEAFRLSLRKHAEMADLGSGEQSRRGIGACSDTRSTSDTGCGIHRAVGIFLGN